jgi:cation diffusion facilitator CzcD-associated flavoprotein CzcO
MSTSSVRVVIIGSGFGGIGAAIRLQQAGVRDIVILERADAVGGTWRDNTYPGAACDIPSHLYSFSFEPKPDWSRRYAPQQEIREYLEHCVDTYGLRPYLRLGRTVEHARFDEDTATWHVTTRDGETFVADVLVPALGALRDPAYPDVAGAEAFAGIQMHTARWRHDVDLDGKRIAVVGTGASAIQVAPELAKTAAELHVLQRSPAWVVPRGDRPYSTAARTLFRLLPFTRALHRAFIYLLLEARFVFFGRSVRLNRLGARVIANVLRRQVKDPALHDKLIPDYRMGCKRILVSDDYYRMFNRANVHLHNEPLVSVTGDGLSLGRGKHLEVDAIVWATGFDVREALGVLDVTGVGGADLRKRWEDRASAYLGTAVPGFPNMFLIVGPNTGLGHNSMVFMIESQLDYLVQAVRAIGRRPRTAVAVREDVLQRFVDGIDARHDDFVWASGCRSWYLDEKGRNFTLWPGTSLGFRLRAARFNPSDYQPT